MADENPAGSDVGKDSPIDSSPLTDTGYAPPPAYRRSKRRRNILILVVVHINLDYMPGNTGAHRVEVNIRLSVVG